MSFTTKAQRNDINNGLAWLSGRRASERNDSKVDPLDREYGIFYAYRAAVEIGDFVRTDETDVSFRRGWELS